MELAKSVEDVKAELTRSIEREKAEMARIHEAHRHKLLELSNQRQDALDRKRDVYTEFATKMRTEPVSSVSVDMKRVTGHGLRFSLLSGLNDREQGALCS